MLESIVSMATSPSSLSIFAVTLVVVYGLKSWLSHPSDQPPMPRLPVPILGHGPFMKPTPLKAMEEWRKKVGDIFTIYLAGRPTVVINSYALLHEAFVKKADSFSDRPKTIRQKLLGTEKDVGIVGSSKEPWKENRSVSVSILRSFGMGKNQMASKIALEVDSLLKILTDLKGEAKEVTQILNSTISNVIVAVIRGERFDTDDPLLAKLVKQNEYMVRLVGPGSLLHPFPFLRFLPGDAFGAKALKQASDDLLELFGGHFIDVFKEDMDDMTSDNFVKAFLREIQKRKASRQQTYLDEHNLKHNLATLFIAGTETTSTTILWALVYALRHPEIQARLYKEIEENVGTERAPEMNDKPKLNYVNAFIMETQRLGSIAPLSVFHMCSQTTKVGGYTIPKDALVIPNLDAVLKHPNNWKDPLEFRPDRFLDQDSKLLFPAEFLPFSIGRRICMGESLAKMELFLFLTAIFQRFEILPEVPNQPPSTDSLFGITVCPLPFRVRFKTRKN